MRLICVFYHCQSRIQTLLSMIVSFHTVVNRNYSTDCYMHLIYSQFLQNLDRIRR